MGKRNLFIIAILFSSVAATAAEASSKIYRHVDQNGHVTFSNKPTKGASRIQTNLSSSKSSHRTVSNKDFPKVTVNKQKKRDLKRRQILETELETEVKLLVDAKQILNSENHTTESQQNVLKRVSLHERNIAALKKELTNL